MTEARPLPGTAGSVIPIEPLLHHSYASPACRNAITQVDFTGLAVTFVSHCYKPSARYLHSSVSMLTNFILVNVHFWGGPSPRLWLPTLFLPVTFFSDVHSCRGCLSTACQIVGMSLHLRHLDISSITQEL